MRIRILTIAFAFLILLLMCSSIIALAASPNITSLSPGERVIDNTVGAERGFEIKINQPVNVNWLINGVVVQTNDNVTEASYVNKSALEGIWNITAIAKNQNGTDTRIWNWRVTKPSILSSIVPALFKPLFPLWFLIVILILVVSTALFIIKHLRRPRVSKEYEELEKENKILQKAIKDSEKELKQGEVIIEKAEDKIMRMKEDYDEYERNKGKIEGFREKCLEEFEEIRHIGEKIKEKKIESVVDVDPFREVVGEALSTAFMEYWNLISSIKTVMKEKERIYEEEKSNSYELIEKLEKEGIDVRFYKKLLEDSNVDGLKVLHSSLNYVNARLGEKEFNPETIKRLKETREEINKMMVDWGIKIVPSKLLDFCETLIKETSLPEEVYPNEKTIETIINLIKEMYIE